METSGLNILLVDDDVDDAEIFRQALIDTHPQNQLTTITDGRKFQGLIRQIPKPDLIVLDINMGAKSGKEILKELKTDGHFEEVPVIILSAYNNPRVIEDCFENGAVKYFFKPGTFVEIKTIVDQICHIPVRMTC